METISESQLKRFLSSASCAVYVEEARSYFKTEPGILEGGVVRDPFEQILIPIEDISRLKLECGSASKEYAIAH